MKAQTRRDLPLLTLALAGLAAYVIACASFSPDDTRVACPAFDAQTGDFGVAVHDRKSGKTEQVFTLSMIEKSVDPSYGTRALRTQWLDNDRLLVMWPGVEKDDETGLNVTCLPVGGKGMTRCWQLADVPKASEKLMAPLALAGSRLLVPVKENLVARLDLNTGRLDSKELAGADYLLYPAGSSTYVFYASKGGAGHKRVEIGKLDAASFATTPLHQLEEFEFSLKTPIAFGPDGRQVALVEQEDKAWRVRLLEPGKTARVLPVPAQVKDMTVGNACFAGKEPALCFSFGGHLNNETNYSLGFWEVPLNGQPPRSTVLLRSTGQDDDDSVVYIQLGVSHDGQSLAVSTTYLFGDGEKASFKPEDCALFLVDLARAPHEVAKVRLPMPKPDKLIK